MFWKCTVAVLLCVILPSPCWARGGGHVTTWDPNLFGGGWVCFQSAVTGCSQGFNAACNGAADDTSALTSFLTFAAANTNVKLYIPPGAKCTFPSANFTAGAHNLIVWAYGVSFTLINSIGSSAFFEDATHHALIASANAGDTTVTVTDGNIARMTVGHWIAVTGLSLQVGGYPPNFAFFEYRLITAINGNVVTLESPLINSYKSTWPPVLVDGGLIPTGPATIYDINQNWNTNVQWYGGAVISPGQLGMSGRDVAFYDIGLQGAGGADPTVSKNWYCFSCFFSSGAEIDKDIENLYFFRGSPGHLTNMSQNLNLTFDSVSINSLNAVNGTGRNLTIRNSNITGGSLGAGFGHSDMLTLDGSNIGAFQCFTSAIPIGTLTYSNTLNGTFSVPNGSNAGVLQWAVPGRTYFFGTINPIVNLGSSFTITDITQDASNTNVITNLPATLPSLGQTHYIAQPIPSVTATNMTGSSSPTNGTGAWCHL